MAQLFRETALDGLYYLGAGKLLKPLAGGVGVVLMLHHVRPASGSAFQPNRTLEVTPEFLESTIRWLRRNDYELVSLDEARTRLIERRFDSRFAALTLDDGYRDNKIWAQPIFARYRVPYALFVPTDFADGRGNLWWDALERIVAGNDRIEVGERVFDCASLRDKYRAFAGLKRMLLDQPDQGAEVSFTENLAARYCPDALDSGRSECMNWHEIRELASDPLATVGAHTISHLRLSKASDADAAVELTQPRRVLEDRLQRGIRHLSYPYGSADVVGEREFAIAAQAGYATAVTTRAGVVGVADGGRLMALPRINLDGELQKERYLDVLMSGVAQAAWHALRQVRNAARPARA